LLATHAQRGTVHAICLLLKYQKRKESIQCTVQLQSFRFAEFGVRNRNVDVSKVSSYKMGYLAFASKRTYMDICRR
jgi:hypothetical protein